MRVQRYNGDYDSTLVRILRVRRDNGECDSTLMRVRRDNGEYDSTIVSALVLNVVHINQTGDVAQW